jgi:hypothetical protein
VDMHFVNNEKRDVKILVEFDLGGHITHAYYSKACVCELLMHKYDVHAQPRSVDDKTALLMFPV